MEVDVGTHGDGGAGTEVCDHLPRRRAAAVASRTRLHRVAAHASNAALIRAFCRHSASTAVRRGWEEGGELRGGGPMQSSGGERSVRGDCASGFHGGVIVLLSQLLLLRGSLLRAPRGEHLCTETCSPKVSPTDLPDGSARRISWTRTGPLAARKNGWASAGTNPAEAHPLFSLRVSDPRGGPARSHPWSGERCGPRRTSG